MGLNIKNAATEAAIRELAAQRGVSLTQAIDEAVRAALSEEIEVKVKTAEDKQRRVKAIVERFASRPRLDPRPSVEIMDDLYDENGLPC